MAIFREKPVFVEARQWDGSFHDAALLMQWVGGGLLTPEKYTDKGEMDGEVLAFLLPTIHGDRPPTAGYHWIVRLPNGNFEMLKPEQMDARYDREAG